MTSGLDLQTLTISAAHELLCDRQISSVELLDATLARVEETEETWHAYVRILERTSRAEAEQADRKFAAGIAETPLQGIPIAIKDLFDVAGTPTEAGSNVFRGRVASTDSMVTARLRQAGAVLIGKTVTHEFGWGVNVPPTRNAHDKLRYPGGSSAGSAVSVALGSAMGAVGTDTAGSIRNPASANGIVGLKPTFGLTSRHGVIPLSPTLDHVGPLARTVQDCALILGAIAGHDPRDPLSLDEPAVDFSAEISQGVAGTRLGVDRDLLLDESLAPDVKQLVERAIEDLGAQGADIVELKLRRMTEVVPAGWTILLTDASAWHQPLLRMHPHLYDPSTRQLLELGLFISGSRYLQAQTARRAICVEMRDVFERQQLDALITPTMSRSAPLADSQSARAVIGERYRILANITGQPAISVPCGYSDDGMPVGVQFIGRPCNETRLLRIANGCSVENVRRPSSGRSKQELYPRG